MEQVKETSKYTNGPWLKTSFNGIKGADGDLVGFSTDSHRTRKEAEENAKLMAAAPEMLAALELLEKKSNAVGCLTENDFQIMMSALNKARGEL